MHASQWTNSYAPLGRNGSFSHKFGCFHIYLNVTNNSSITKTIFRKKGESPTLKLNLGIVMDKNGDFLRQISMTFFKNLSAAAKCTTSLDIYCTYHA